MHAVSGAGAGAEDGAGAYLQDSGQGARAHAVSGAGAGAERTFARPRAGC